MNLYIIPANSNAGKLIFNLFTKFDLILMGSGTIITILAVTLFQPSSFQSFLFCILPLLIGALLVIPIPHYHNVYTVLKELIEFFYKRRNYKWEGWCDRNE